MATLPWRIAWSAALLAEPFLMYAQADYVNFGYIYRDSWCYLRECFKVNPHFSHYLDKPTSVDQYVGHFNLPCLPFSSTT